MAEFQNNSFVNGPKVVVLSALILSAQYQELNTMQERFWQNRTTMYLKMAIKVMVLSADNINAKNTKTFPN